MADLEMIRQGTQRDFPENASLSSHFFEVPTSQHFPKRAVGGRKAFQVEEPGCRIVEGAVLLTNSGAVLIITMRHSSCLPPKTLTVWVSLPGF